MSNKKTTDFSQLRDKIYRFALRLLGCSEEAQDVAHDILEKLLHKKKIEQQIENEEAFSMKMTRDLCADRLKQKITRQEKRNIFNQNENTTHEKYDLTDLADLAKKCINQLPEKQKMIIHLRDVECYEFEEIAQLMEMEISAVRMNLSRARKAVRENVLKLSNYGL